MKRVCIKYQSRIIVLNLQLNNYDELGEEKNIRGTESKLLIFFAQ